MAPLGVLRASLGPQVADVEVGVVSYGGQFTLGFSQCQLHRWAPPTFQTQRGPGIPCSPGWAMLYCPSFHEVCTVSKIAIIGAGAVGSYIGAFLTKEGEECPPSLTSGRNTWKRSKGGA